MGITILVRWHLHIETAPWWDMYTSHNQSNGLSSVFLCCLFHVNISSANCWVLHSFHQSQRMLINIYLFHILPSLTLDSVATRECFPYVASDHVGLFFANGRTLYIYNRNYSQTHKNTELWSLLSILRICLCTEGLDCCKMQLSW